MFSIKEKEMLLKLFRLFGKSGNEKPILDFIISILESNNIPYKQDDKGNIYCLNYKGEPLLSAHTDCVGSLEAGYYVEFVDIYPYGNDEIMKGIGNIGGDDKCGVFLILLYLLSGKPINAVFSVCEEIGGADGIKHLLPLIKDDEIFKSIPYCMVLDRKHAGDIISSQNNYCSKRFENAVAEIGKKYGYKPVVGGNSDMNTIKDYMNGCNLSVGYYNPHSNTEFVSLNNLFNTWIFLNDLIKNMPRDIPLEKQVTNPNYYSNDYFNYYDW